MCSSGKKKRRILMASGHDMFRNFGDSFSADVDQGVGMELGDFRYRMGGWPESSNYEVGIELRIDLLASLIVLAVTFVGFLNTIYSKTRVLQKWVKRVRFSMR